MNKRHRIVILGGGFAGLCATQELRSADADVTLIDRRNFHLFQPLLYQIATGSLSPADVCSPLRAVLSSQANARVLMGEATAIDPAVREIALRSGETIPYDTLIVALGSETSYFGHDAWREHAPCLKGIEDATEMRRRIFTAFETAELEGVLDSSPWLSFVIVGGGPTGVELAGALSEIARKTLREDFRSIHPEFAQITLLDHSPRLLPALSPNLAEKAEAALLGLGVRVRCGVLVTNIDENGVQMQLPDGTVTQLRSKTVLWAGGVSMPAIVRDLAAATGALTERGRIKVQPDLTIPNHPEIFVAGDIAALQRPDGTWLPGVAQVAMQQGTYAARVIKSRLKNAATPPAFAYSDRGDMAVIGRASAVAKVFGLELWGWPAWLVWLFIHLMYLVEFQNRVVVFVRWGFQYLTFSRGSRLITGGDNRKSLL